MYKKTYPMQVATTYFVAEKEGEYKAPAKEEPKKDESPNADWKDDPRLDENGNPKEETTPEKEPAKDPVKEEPKKEDDKQDDKAPEPTKVDLTSPVVAQVEKLVVDAGLNPSEVAKLVTENGGAVTPAMMQALVAKHGEAVASLVAEQLKGFHTANVAKTTSRDKAVYDQVATAFEGVTEQTGQESWKELSAWAKVNVPDAERKEINKVLAQGGIATKYAVDDLISRFKNSETYTQPADLETGSNVAKVTGAEPLSKADYTRQLRALADKGHVYGQSAEMAALDARRSKSIERGH